MSGDVDFEFLQDAVDRAIRGTLGQRCCVSKWLLVAETVVGVGGEGQGLWCVASENAKPWDTYGFITNRDCWKPADELAGAIQAVFDSHEHSLTTKMVAVVEVVTDSGVRELRFDVMQGMQPWDTDGLLRFAMEEESAHHRIHE